MPHKNPLKWVFVGWVAACCYPTEQLQLNFFCTHDKIHASQLFLAMELISLQRNSIVKYFFLFVQNDDIYGGSHPVIGFSSKLL
jgi:hypothetical protein